MIVTSCFVIGCQKEDSLEINNNIDGYLSLPDGFDLLNLSDDESQILQTAFSRMSIFSETEIFKTKFTSGSQINMSEDLFDFFNNMINKSNKSQEISLSSPRLKSGTESTTNNDCVAYSIYNALNYFSSSVSLNSIKTYLQEQYGTNGVLMGSVTSAITHYLKGSTTTITSNYMPPSGTKVIIVIPGNPLHAVNLFGCTNGTAVYTDSSSGSSSGMIEVSKISYAFAATGKK
jgi:hypothetical protein